MSTLNKVQLAAALVATFGFCTAGAVNAADNTVTEKQSPSRIAQADSAGGEKTEAPKKEKKEKKAKKEKKEKKEKKADKGSEGSCKGKEGSCKGKDGSCKGGESK